MGTMETCAKNLKQSKFDFKRADSKFLKTELARAYKPRICFIISSLSFRLSLSNTHRYVTFSWYSTLMHYSLSG